MALRAGVVGVVVYALATAATAQTVVEGFGASTRGGAGRRAIHVTRATDAAVRAAFAAAAGGNAQIVFDVDGPIAIASPLPRIKGANVTIEGNGATLTGDAIERIYPIVDIRGHDVIVRNLRLRNGGDNLRAQGTGAYNIVFDHISSTGSGDDGVSIGYGAHDVTLQWSFLAGDTRSIFIKYYEPQRISVHHNWIMKYWSRGPLVSSATAVDYRNNVLEDWDSWGARWEYTASGNAVNNLFVLSPFAHKLGGKVSALRLVSTGPTYSAGNEFRDDATSVRESAGSSRTPIDVAPVTTLPVAQMEPLVRAHAGCMPRDAWDQAYIDADRWTYIGYSTPLRLPAP